MSFLPRMVFDTSTLVSAALRVGSMPHQALVRALAIGEICVSTATLSELDKVLRRSKFDRYQSAAVRAEFAALIRQHAVLIDVSSDDEANVKPACRDAKDNLFLALLLASAADVLVSSDADLLVLHPWRGVPIVTPAQYLVKGTGIASV